MPKRDAAYMERRRDEILDAAEIRLQTADIEHFTIEEICQQAGVSVGALYRHFANKRELLLGLLDRAADERDSAAIDTLAGVEDYLMEALERLDRPDGPQVMRMNFQLLQISLGDPEMLAKVRKSIVGVENFIADALHRCVARGDIAASTDVDHAAKRLANLYRGIWLTKIVDTGIAATESAYCIGEEIERLRGNTHPG